MAVEPATVVGVRPEHLTATRRPWLARSEARFLLRVSDHAVDRLLRAGLLRDVSTDRRRRIDPDGVLELVRSRVQRGELGPLALLVAQKVVAGQLRIVGDPPPDVGGVLAVLRANRRLPRDAAPEGR